MARKLVMDRLKSSDDLSAIIEIERVGLSGYDPRHDVLHEGRVGRLGSALARYGDSLQEEVELRAALVAVTVGDPGFKVTAKLSPKELLYLDMLCDGITDADAAKKLSVSLRAIKARKKMVCQKTNSDTISHAISKYIRSRPTRHGNAKRERRRVSRRITTEITHPGRPKKQTSKKTPDSDKQGTPQPYT